MTLEAPAGGGRRSFLGSEGRRNTGGGEQEDNSELSSVQTQSRLFRRVRRGLLSRNGMLDLIPRRGEIELDAVGILVALEALRFDGLRTAIEDEPVLDGLGLVFHDGQLPVRAPGTMASLAGNPLGLELGSLLGERGMTLEAARILAGLVDAHGLGGVGRLRGCQGLEGLGMLAALPDHVLPPLGLRSVADLAFLGADVGEVLSGKRRDEKKCGQGRQHHCSFHGPSPWNTRKFPDQYSKNIL